MPLFTTFVKEVSSDKNSGNIFHLQEITVSALQKVRGWSKNAVAALLDKSTELRLNALFW